MSDEKITIIEGPSPTFELVNDNWVNSIVDSPSIANVAVTQLRTFNGPALLERCHKAWRQKDPINLEFKAHDGSTLEVPIVAARATDGQDGQLLFLWVRLPNDGIEYEDDNDWDIGEDEDDDLLDLDR